MSAVRLTGTDIPSYGRLEIHDGTSWTAVCDDGFAQSEADVTCRHLGYATGMVDCCSALGPRPTNVPWGFRDMKCAGNEQHPLDCPHKSDGKCLQGRYVSLLCLQGPTAEGN